LLRFDLSRAVEVLADGCLWGEQRISRKGLRRRGRERDNGNRSVRQATDRKIRIGWSDKANKIVSGVDVFGSKWVGPGGVHVGSTIAELEKANGKPFTFSGLGWDYGGLVKDWRGGALGPVKPTHGGPGNLPPDCRLDVELASAPSAPKAATAAVSGEQDFKSDDPEAAAARIIVAKITFSYGN